MIKIKEIPFFSVRDINVIEDYERFYHTRAYLLKKSGKLRYKRKELPKLKIIAEKSGYKKFNKFIRHREEWHELTRKIPLAYLQAIKAKLDVIKFTVGLDKKEYEELLKIPIYPKFATEKMMSVVYRTIELPPGTDEKEAIELMRDYSSRKKRLCWIKINNIKTIFFFPDGNYKIDSYKPGIKITKKHLIPTAFGRGIGKVYVI